MGTTIYLWPDDGVRPWCKGTHDTPHHLRMLLEDLLGNSKDFLPLIPEATEFNTK